MTKQIVLLRPRPQTQGAARSGDRARSRPAPRRARPSARDPHRMPSALAIEARCCIPPESCQGNLLARNLTGPPSSSTRATRSGHLGARIPHDFQRQAPRFSGNGPPRVERRRPETRTHRRALSRACSGRLPVDRDRIRLSVARDPRSTRRNVVFPQPEGPMKD